jgi:hypothetical protein
VVALRATLTSSLERGTPKSRHRSVVAGCMPVNVEKHKITMKAKQPENNFKSRLRGIFRRRTDRHDPMLVLNMSIFNFTDGWSRTFSKHQYARFNA